MPQISTDFLHLHPGAEAFAWIKLATAKTLALEFSREDAIPGRERWFRLQVRIDEAECGEQRENGWQRLGEAPQVKIGERKLKHCDRVCLLEKLRLPQEVLRLEWRG